MGLLGLFSRNQEVRLSRLPSGSFTLNGDGGLVVSTLSSQFPTEQIDEIGSIVLEAFRAAKGVQLPLKELVIQYATLRISARELRGGAIVFVSPRKMS